MGFYLMLSWFPFESPDEDTGNIVHSYKQNVLPRISVGLLVRARTEVYAIWAEVLHRQGLNVCSTETVDHRRQECG